MKVRYWKASFLGGTATSSAPLEGVSASVAASGLNRPRQLPTGSVAPLAAVMKGSSEVLIEVWQFDEASDDGVLKAAANRLPWHVVLISSPQGNPDALTCGLGFGSDSWVCDRLREGGLPILDAKIDASALPMLTIEVPSFVDGEAMSFTEQLIVLEGVDLSVPAVLAADTQEALGQAGVHAAVATARSGSESDRTRRTRFLQQLVTPQVLRPVEEISARPIEFNVQREDMRVIATEGSNVKAKFRAARFPDLQPLSGELDGRDASCGKLADFRLPPFKAQPAPIRTRRREDAFVPGRFNFDNVEVLGFRIDLDEELGDRAEELLNKLVEPLNFHRKKRRYALPDFIYQAGTRTINIELLRYGKMALDEDSGLLTPQDYQSQHELVVRIMVGRVDDDTSQARDPAVFVPAIFVDNAWSKVLGREGQGFDKRLAVFRSCIGGPLRADGFPLDGGRRSRVRVEDIDDICLAGTVGADSDASLLRLEIPRSARNDSNLDEVDLDLALGDSALTGAAWRQQDFSQADFRRSFAGRVMRDKTLGFRSVQISPISSGGGFPSAWLVGRFDVERVLVGYPAGVASLRFRSPPGAPEAWKWLCESLDGNSVDLPTGDWYRMRTKMRLTLEDSLH